MFAVAETAKTQLQYINFEFSPAFFRYKDFKISRKVYSKYFSKLSVQFKFHWRHSTDASIFPHQHLVASCHVIAA